MNKKIWFIVLGVGAVFVALSLFLFFYQKNELLLDDFSYVNSSPKKTSGDGVRKEIAKEEKSLVGWVISFNLQEIRIETAEKEVWDLKLAENFNLYEKISGLEQGERIPLSQLKPGRKIELTGFDEKTMTVEAGWVEAE